VTPDARRSLALGAAAALVAASGAVAAVRHVAVSPTPAAVSSPLSASPVASAPSVTPSPSPAAPRPSRRVVAAPLYPLPAPAATPSGCPPPKRPRGKPYVPWRPSVVVPESALPAPLPALHRTPSLDALRGKGMWTYEWERTEHGSARAVVARAKAAGLTQLWVRTGSSKSGFYAASTLRTLLPLAHAAGLKVVAWDFPYLYDPVGDASRAAATLAFSSGGERIDAFSPDVESPSEGTQSTRLRLRVYLGLLQRAAGSRPVVSTVPHANDHWWKTYDYRTQVPYVDAFAVMAYWNCTEPGVEVARSVARLAPLGRPLHLIGQTFDFGPYGGRAGDPTGREVWRFLDVAKRRNMLGASFYVWQHATREQFRALGAYPWG
jgi:hypothetical protein